MSGVASWTFLGLAIVVLGSVLVSLGRDKSLDTVAACLIGILSALIAAVLRMP